MMLSGKLHCQIFFSLKSFSYKITRTKVIERTADNVFAINIAIKRSLSLSLSLSVSFFLSLCLSPPLSRPYVSRSHSARA